MPAYLSGTAGANPAERIAFAARHAGAFAGRVVPHLSIAMGPQVAAALHVAAAASNCDLCEYNPTVLVTANAFLATPLACTGGLYTVPTALGIGIE